VLQLSSHRNYVGALKQQEAEGGHHYTNSLLCGWHLSGCGVLLDKGLENDIFLVRPHSIGGLPSFQHSLCERYPTVFDQTLFG